MGMETIGVLGAQFAADQLMGGQQPQAQVSPVPGGGVPDPLVMQQQQSQLQAQLLQAIMGQLFTGALGGLGGLMQGGSQPGPLSVPTQPQRDVLITDPLKPMSGGG